MEFLQPVLFLSTVAEEIANHHRQVLHLFAG